MTVVSCSIDERYVNPLFEVFDGGDFVLTSYRDVEETSATMQIFVPDPAGAPLAASALAAADLVVSRAGASSIAEIAALAVPSVLVPYPLATADHQTTNARYLVDSDAAVMFADDTIDGDAFRSTVLELIDDDDRRNQMRQKAKGLAQDQAAAVLADQVVLAAGIA